ncbi:hypothetical protein BASA81_017926 [Batrachochytrium salamandrivorans]|nr:hypothetical protein BASA81_017926 [Batrachochytrium salamandrivorans]
MDGNLPLLPPQSYPFLLVRYLPYDHLNYFSEKSKRAYERSAQVACEAVAAIRTVQSLTREEQMYQSYRKLLELPLRDGFRNAWSNTLLYALSQTVNFLVNAPCILKTHYRFEFYRGEKLDRAKVQGWVEFKNVTFSYPTRPNIKVLKGLNVTIKPGQLAAFGGPSGCGKSTTIGLLERFYNISSGSVLLDNRDISKINVSSYRDVIGLVSQEPNLFDFSIRDNITFGCKTMPSQEEIEAACREANIHEFIVSLPDGYETRAGAKGDAESEKVVQEALDKASKGRTTIAIAHRLSTIQHADIIFVINEGVVAEQGTHSELFEMRGIYYDLVVQQDLESTA